MLPALWWIWFINTNINSLTSLPYYNYLSMECVGNVSEFCFWMHVVKTFHWKGCVWRTFNWIKPVSRNGVWLKHKQRSNAHTICYLNIFFSPTILFNFLLIHFIQHSDLFIRNISYRWISNMRNWLIVFVEFSESWLNKIEKKKRNENAVLIRRKKNVSN